jgi:hypothetical protein
VIAVQEVTAVVNGWELFLIALGLAFQIVGAAVTFAGIYAIWCIVAKEGETFRSLLVAQLRTTSRSIIDAARRLISKPEVARSMCS